MAFLHFRNELVAAVTNQHISKAMYALRSRVKAKRPADARKLSHSTLEEIRIRAVKQVEAGECPPGFRP